MSNKGLVGLNIALVIAVIVLFVLQFMDGPDSAEESSKEETVAEETIVNEEDPIPAISLDDTSEIKLPSFNKGLKVAYVNADSLNLRYNYNLDAGEKLRSQYNRAKGKYEGQVNAYMIKRNQFAEEYQKGIMGEAEIQRRSEELGAKEQELGQMEMELNQDLQEKQMKIQAEVVKNTRKFLDKIGAELGYDFVLSYSGEVPTVYYVNPEYDITDYVIKKLNEAYATQKSAE